MDIVFVILNYNTYDETLDCMASIKDKIDTENYKIIIVDNASENDSVEKLSEFVAQNRQYVELICNKQNLGFAKGNNVGLRYAIQHYNFKFIVVLNSDTELIQKDFYKKVNHEYQSSHFALMGPMIITADGRCDNSPQFPPTKKMIQDELKAFKIEYKFIYCGMYWLLCTVRKVYKIIYSNLLCKEVVRHRNMDFHQYQQQVVLQGSFMVFSSKAFEYVDGFNEETFLYYEELILYLKLMHYELKTVYKPDICIYHKDGCATNKLQCKRKKKLLFINKCYQDSAKILLKIMEFYKQK